jgi:SHS2 domain-containing protein
MDTPVSGFEELPHTADMAIHVWAESLPALFAEAARGMNTLSGAQPVPGVRLKRSFEARAPDTESLLVAFLSELVFYIEKENLVFFAFKINLNGENLKIQMSGAPILSLIHSIKAVTYHNLQIRKAEAGFQVEIVFDV